MHSEYRNLIVETLILHVQLIWYDTKYLRAYFTQLNWTLHHFKLEELKDIMKDEDKMRKSKWMKICLLCSIAETCNLRHLHTVCNHPTIESIQNDMFLLIESTLQKLFNCSDTIHHIYCNSYLK